MNKILDRLRNSLAPAHWRDVFRHYVCRQPDAVVQFYGIVFPDLTDDEVLSTIKTVPGHYAGMSTVQATMTAGFQFTVGNNQTGSAYGQIGTGANIQTQYAFGTANANNASGGGDEIFSFQIAVNNGAQATINTVNMTNQLAQSGVNIARIKGYQIRLLSATNDTTITVPAATNGLVTNEYVGAPCPLDLGFVGGGLAVNTTVNSVTGAVTAVAVMTAGNFPANYAFLFGLAQNTAGAQGFVASALVNAAGNVSSVNLIAGGANYANTSNVPTTPLGSRPLNQGGAHLYFDQSAAGFVQVSNIACNLRLINLDPNNTATFEFSALAATT